MPATKTELTNRQEFKGDVFDRQYSVHRDPTTGMFSFDYADITPELALELQKIKFYRVTSTDLRDIEEELKKSKDLSGESRIPNTKPTTNTKPETQTETKVPETGEITKAVEAQSSEFKEDLDAFLPLQEKVDAGEELNEEDAKKYDSLFGSIQAKIRQRKLIQAKKRYNEFQLKANESGTNLSNEDKTKSDFYARIIDAFETIEEVEEKEKRGEPVNASNLTRKIEAIEFLDSDEVDEVIRELEDVAEIVEKLERRQAYKNSKALLQQFTAVAVNKRTPEDVKRLEEAHAVVNAYEGTKKNKPVGPENVNVGFGKNENWAGGKRRTRKNRKSNK